MRYTIADLDITRALPAIELGKNDRGLALLLRKDGRPISFFMRALSPATLLSPETLAGLICDSSGLDLLKEHLRTELSEPGQAPRPLSLTIVICTRGRPSVLADCLRSLQRMLLDRGDSYFQICVIDNAPPDAETRDLVRSFANINYVCEPRPGLDFARNRALTEISSEFVAFLDDDVEADLEWLAGLEDALAENPDAACITGLVLPFELESRAQVNFESRGGFRRGFAKLRYCGAHLPGNRLYPVGAGIFGAGCNMVLRREVALGLGGFDEALDTGPPLPGGGDLDVFYRVVRAGHPLVYEPRMVVFHKHRREDHQLRRQYWTWGTGFMAFVAKTYATEPTEHRKLRGLVRWWLFDELRELARSVRGRRKWMSELIGAELAGGLVGLAGAYPRSVRRTRRIDQRFT